MIETSITARIRARSRPVSCSPEPLGVSRDEISTAGSLERSLRHGDFPYVLAAFLEIDFGLATDGPVALGEAEGELLLIQFLDSDGKFMARTLREQSPAMDVFWDDELSIA